MLCAGRNVGWVVCPCVQFFLVHLPLDSLTYLYLGLSILGRVTPESGTAHVHTKYCTLLPSSPGQAGQRDPPGISPAPAASSSSSLLESRAFPSAQLPKSLRRETQDKRIEARRSDGCVGMPPPHFASMRGGSVFGRSQLISWSVRSTSSRLVFVCQTDTFSVRLPVSLVADTGRFGSCLVRLLFYSWGPRRFPIDRVLVVSPRLRSSRVHSCYAQIQLVGWLICCRAAWVVFVALSRPCLLDHLAPNLGEWFRMMVELVLCFLFVSFSGSRSSDVFSCLMGLPGIG